MASFIWPDMLLTVFLGACSEPGAATLTLSCWLCSFNVNELIAVQELHSRVAEAGGQPIVVFNGELDRIRWVLASKLSLRGVLPQVAAPSVMFLLLPCVAGQANLWVQLPVRSKLSALVQHARQLLMVALLGAVAVLCWRVLQGGTLLCSCFMCKL